MDQKKANIKQPKVLFLAPYPSGKGPSQRFRLEIYLPSLKKAGIEYNYRTFYNLYDYDKIYSRGNFLSKFLIVLKGFAKRCLLLPSLYKYNYVFVQREITPIGPPIFEWLITKVFRKKLIYDFDDAIWMPNYSEENASFQRLKSYWKVKHLIRWSWRVVAGNDYLEEYALQFNAETRIIPTIVDTISYHNPSLYEQPKKSKMKLVWTGSLTTNMHIEYLQPVFQRLSKKYNFDLVVISNKKPNIQIQNLVFIEWQSESEMDSLANADIGLMPLIPDFEFAKGKCGFKAIQYMSLSIPTVVTPLGINTQIVSNLEDGYYAQDLDDWYDVLDKLLQNPSIAEPIKENALKKIKKLYSLEAHKSNFISLFN